ncbi:MAG: hypothetical protein DWQ02_26845 [Bacteroidetes bacterium]|nr:MAG: hypothetical protein DWQ02_26845 [Bacteroidota bacterium]
MKITAKHLPAGKITVEEKEEMYAILHKYFGNISPEKFADDLLSKDRVIIMKDENTGQVVGFSTQKIFETQFLEEDVIVVYSGDTIVDEQYWRSIQLPRTFWDMIQSISRNNPGKRIFWMLISKGVRTYRFLPVFYNSFYPSYQHPIPEDIQLFMHKIGKYIFPERYDPGSGIIKSFGKHQFLKLQYHPRKDRNKDLHERFFYEKNPKFYEGDELLCLVETKLSNLKPYFQELFSQ